MLHYVVLAGSFFTVTCLFIGLYNLVFASRLAVLNRLETHTMDPDDMIEAEEVRSRGFSGELLHFMGVLGKMFPRRSYVDIIQKKLTQARVFMRAEEFIGLTIVSAVLLFIILYLLTGAVLLALVGLILGYKIPGIMIDMKKNKRMNALNQQLPEALSIVSSGLRAGFSFPQAMSVVSKEMPPPISEEFYRVIRENRLGKSMDEVLTNFSERTDNEDIDMFVTALLIQRQVGGNLAEVLDNISHTIRERIRIKGEIKTLTAQGRMSAVIVCLLPIVVAGFVFILNPEYMLTLIEEPIGVIMICFAVMLQLIGILLIRKIIDIEI